MTRRATKETDRPPNGTRERLLFAAMQLFAEKGYGSTSVADILQAADANAGSMYYFFPGKQDLLIAVLKSYLAGIQPMLLAPAWNDVDDPIERVFALLASYRNALARTQHTYGCPIGSLALELHEPDPSVRKLIAANFGAWIDAVEQCYYDARNRLPRDIDCRALAVFTLTTMEGAVMIARTERGIAPFDSSVKSLRNYISILEDTAASAKSGRTAKRT